MAKQSTAFTAIAADSGRFPAPISVSSHLPVTPVQGISCPLSTSGGTGIHKLKKNRYLLSGEVAQALIPALRR